MHNIFLTLLTTLLFLVFTWSPVHAETPKQSYEKGYERHMKSNYLDAAKYYTKAINGNPSYAQAYQMRAAAYHSLKDYGRALQDYTRVIELGEKFFIPVAYFNRGVVNYDSGRYKAAIMDYSRAVSYDNRMALAYVHRGIAKGRIGDKSGQVRDFLYAARYGDFEVKKWLEKHAPHVLERN